MILLVFCQVFCPLVNKHELSMRMYSLSDEHERELVLYELNLWWQLSRLGIHELASEAAIFTIPSHKVQILRAFTIGLRFFPVRSEERLDLIEHLLIAFILVEVRVTVGVDLCQKLELLMEHLSCLALGLPLLLCVIRCVVLTVPLD